jgi:peptide-methionine (S)-S-oxide reductase
VFQLVRGVHRVESGYAGGHTHKPSYEDICTGQTGHAEVVQVHFDPNIISYEHILHIFFSTHDASTLNRQGHDVGTQYRSAIFVENIAQEQIAKDMCASVAAAFEPLGKMCTTQVSYLAREGAEQYTAAEDYHQNYYNNHPFQGYCAGVVAPKVAKFRKTMQTYLKS